MADLVSIRYVFKFFLIHYYHHYYKLVLTGCVDLLEVGTGCCLYKY